MLANERALTIIHKNYASGHKRRCSKTKSRYIPIVRLVRIKKDEIAQIESSDPIVVGLNSEPIPFQYTCYI